MQTARQLIEWLIGFITRVMKKQLTTEDKAVLVMVGVGLTVLIVGALTANLWLPIATGVGFVIWGIWPNKSQQPVTQSIVPVYQVVYQELFAVLCDVHGRIGATRPLDVSDITMMPPMAIRNGIEIVKAKIAKHRRGNFELDDLRLSAKVIQARIDDRLRSGVVENIPFVSLDNQTPIFWVDSVHDDVAHLYIDLIVVDTSEKLRFVGNSQFPQTTTPPHDPSDEDF
jgi:hypothetical protein